MELLEKTLLKDYLIDAEINAIINAIGKRNKKQK